jgi:hypothetical protein
VTRRVLAICAVIGASLGAIAGTDRRDPAWEGVSAATDELSRSVVLRGEVDRLRMRFDSVRRELAAADTAAAATVVREKLFQLRVDMVPLEDELAVFARRR